MIKRNKNYTNLAKGYLFPEIAKRRKTFQAQHPEAKIISLGIGNTTEPLAPHIVEEMKNFVEALGTKEGYEGYQDDSAGMPKLRERISKAIYNGEIKPSEIFVSDGAKCDLGRLQAMFGADVNVAVQDPSYPVYVDGTVMAGAGGKEPVTENGFKDITYMPCLPENGFFPDLSVVKKDSLIYICSPNNPTGAVATKENLTELVKFAKANGCVVLFDAAYSAFICDENLPKSIYEIEGAKTCAIEFCSLSKTAGFTGTRCGYTIVPHALVKEDTELNRMWLRRQTTKFNGVPYIVQRGAEAVFSEEGLKQIKENINYYKENAKIITSALDECGIKYFGGKNSPYIWLKCPNGLESWEFFDLLLTKINVVGTPGAGFGENGKNYFRLTAFSTHEKTAEAMKRLKKLLLK